MVPIGRPQVRIDAGAKREEFIDHEFGLAALDLNTLDRPCEYVGLDLIVDAVADADSGAKQLVDAFKAGGNVHAVSQGRVAQPVRTPDIADQDVAAVEPDPPMDSRSSFRLPGVVDAFHATRRPQCRRAAA